MCLLLSAADSFCLADFGLLASGALGLFQVGMQARADRYTYVPVIGLFVMASWGIPELLRTWRYRKKALAVLSPLILLCSLVVTWKQVGYWRNSLPTVGHIF